MIDMALLQKATAAAISAAEGVLGDAKGRVAFVVVARDLENGGPCNVGTNITTGHKHIVVVLKEAAEIVGRVRQGKIITPDEARGGL